MSITYSELSHKKKELRLLKLLPSFGPKYAHIPCCQLLRTELRDAPKYEALSYTWGDPNTNRVILVDGNAVRVPQNLFDALLGLRARHSHSIVWVDYLCINQQSDQEKSWQVGLMRDIYSQAEKVLVWLGPGDSKSRRAMAYLDKLGKEAYACGFYRDLHAAYTLWHAMSIAYSSHPGKVTPQMVPYMLLKFLPFVLLRLSEKRRDCLFLLWPQIKLFHKLWTAAEEESFPLQDLKALLKRPWFERVWVLQEIALSKVATLICGTAEIDRVKLATATTAYSCFRLSLSATLLKLTPFKFGILQATFFRPLTLACAPRIKMMPVFPLIALLRLTCVGSPNLERHGPHHLNSTDPRDKIFGLLGLSTDRYDLLSRGLRPDYTKSCQEVYILATSIMLQQGHISLLSMVQPGRLSTHALPSWVPDWSQPITEPFQVWGDDHMVPEPEFFASGSRDCTPRVKVNLSPMGPQRISLMGIICDKVHSVGHFPKRVTSWTVPYEETYSWPQEWFTEIFRLSYRANKNYASFEERLRSVTRASVAGERGAGMVDETILVRADEDLLSDARTLLRKCVHRMKSRLIKREAQRYLAGSRGWKQPKVSEPRKSGLTGNIIGRCLKRLPFVTTMGRLGLGYDNIREGDVAVIIRGAQVPYVLRPQQNGEFSLVSEAYIDGIMDGEALAGATFTWLSIV